MTEPPTYRRCRLTESWIIVAPARRVNTMGVDPLQSLPTPSGHCPFCPGREAETEATLASWPPEGPWRVRAVGNLYPAAIGRAVETSTTEAGRRELPATGAHEVIVDAPEHDLDFPDFSDEQVKAALRIYRDRLRALEAVPGVAHVSLFRNRGRRAGSSQPHPHAQIFASTLLGPEQERRWEVARRFAAERGESLHLSVLEEELESGARVIEADAEHVLLVPFAARQNFETWLMPRDPRGSFADLTDPELDAFALRLRDGVARTLKASGKASYNLIFRIPPSARAGDPAAAWYVEILPRGGGFAGLELSSGLRLVTVTPEEAAERIRAIDRS